ncbi:AraC family transcriptional regulator [Nocardia sp. NPDC051463]|uniref:AraC family transcriptional regulator n=1 Tax=Nocardia sp. NPDC051463 TaxID=3154845 RepID=UPI003448A564
MEHRAAFVESATTHAVTPNERTDYWAELINSYHRRLGYAFLRPRDFEGRTTLHRTGNYQLIGWESDAVTYYRTAGLVRRDSDDDYRLLLPTKGPVAVWTPGQHARMPAGVGVLVTIDQPFAYSMVDDNRGLLMTIPRREIDRRLGPHGLSARPVDFTTGLGRVVADLAGGLLAEGAALTHHQFDAVSDRLVELLCMHIVGDYPTAPNDLADVESAVRRYIRTHAEDPDLTGTTVANALGWSLRQIQLVLQRGDTTPRQLIKEERLQIAYARLRNPAYRHWSITTIALGLGFGSASAFSTAFRQRFNATPRDIREG